jgi:hypothetical protein
LFSLSHTHTHTQYIHTYILLTPKLDRQQTNSRCYNEELLDPAITWLPPSE